MKKEFLLKEARKRISLQGLRQVEIAKGIGCRASQLSKFINGWEDLPEKYHLPLCKILGLNVNDSKMGGSKDGN